MSESRVPRTIPEFNNYINSSDDYLQLTRSDRTNPNFQELGLSPLQGTDWTNKRTFWRDTLYPKYTNPSLSTSPVKTQVKNFMKSFSVFARPLLDIMAVSVKADEEDEAQLRFLRKVSYKSPTHHTEEIEDTCYAIIKPLGGDKMKFGCSTESDTKKKSLAPTAESVMVSYIRIDKAIENPTLPEDPEDCPKQQTFTKASFVLDAGTGKSGDRLVGFLQWNDSKNPSRKGPESERFDVTIL
jgi:hypothetical protein